MRISVRRITGLWRIKVMLACANVWLFPIHPGWLSVVGVVPRVARVCHLIVPAGRQHWRISTGDQTASCSARLVDSVNHNPVLVNIVDARSVRLSPDGKVVEHALALQPDTNRARPCRRVVVVNLDSAPHVSENAAKRVCHDVVIDFYCPNTSTPLTLCAVSTRMCVDKLAIADHISRATERIHAGVVLIVIF
jgi:hypothetical protein